MNLLKRRNVLKGLFGAFFAPFIPIPKPVLKPKIVVPTEAVWVGTRRLRTLWSEELARDLMSLHAMTDSEVYKCLEDAFANEMRKPQHSNFCDCMGETKHIEGL
jgi:hypothetical protein